MGVKTKIGIIVILVALVGCIIFCRSIFHVNDVSQIQVVQGVMGDVTIRKEAGFYIKFFPKIWTYEKTRQIAFSFEKQESKDDDGAEVFFSDRSKGKVNFQITYELILDNESVLRMHALAKGDDDVLDKRILAVLRETAICEAGKFTATDATTDKKGEFIVVFKSKLFGNKDFEEVGIRISQFTITKVDPDEKTVAAFEQAREAEQQKRIAEVQEAKFVMEKKRVEAEAAMQIAEAKGKAEVEKMKAETDAEKEKQLAVIAGEQRVEVAELDKKEAAAKAEKEAEVARIEAEMAKKVAEIEVETEELNLKKAELKAKQMIAEVDALAMKLEKGGGIKESDKIRLEEMVRRDIEVAKAIAEGLKNIKLPTNFIWGGGNGVNGEKGNLLEYLINLITIQKANEVAGMTAPAEVQPAPQPAPQPKPQAQPAPKPAPQPAPAKPAQQAVKPEQVVKKKVNPEDAML